MAKKNEEIEEVIHSTNITTASDVTGMEVESKPVEVTADFGREDLNALRDAVNFLIRKA